jgi:fatty acid desaturase
VSIADVEVRIAGETPAGPLAEDPRETMRRLPRFLQHPLSVFTGKALPGQRSRFWSPGFHLAAAALSTAAGVAVGSVGLALGHWWAALLVPGWALTLHGMRNLRMMIYHQCSHRNLFRRRLLDTLIGRLVSGALVVQNFERYSREHVSDHHAAHHMTLRDPTVQAFLVSLELRPGMTPRQMWRRVLAKLVSPRFHAAFATARMRSFWNGSAAFEKSVFVVGYGLAAVATGATGTWPIFLAVWFVPLLPLFQISNTLRLCVKHTFPPAGTERRRGRDYFASLTNAIFIGEPVPDRSLPAARRLLAWTRWTLRMALIHVPARYLVLTGDTVVHDFHHRYPSSKEWFDYIFARQRDIDAGHPGWCAYHEVWGLAPAITHVFASLSAADPDEYNLSHLRSVSRRELFAAFDD